MSLGASQKYQSARDAAARVGYTGDYVTRLAREGKIDARKEGRAWVVDIDSLKLFTLQAEAEKRARGEELREERLNERYRVLRQAQDDVMLSQIDTGNVPAFVETVAIALCLFLGVNLIWFSVESDLNTAALVEGVATVSHQMTAAVIDPIPDMYTRVTHKSTVKENENILKIQEPLVEETAAKPGLTSADSDFDGVIITPADETQKQTQAIRETFSDEVEVEFDSTDSGVVTPVFREREGESYRLRLEPAGAEDANI